MQLQPHEYANIFPMMNANDMRSLLDDMKANGYDQSAPIMLYDGKILDGRNRYAASLQLGIEPTFADYQGDDPLRFVVRHNLNRRHLNDGQRAAVASKLANMSVGGNGANQHKSNSANLQNCSLPELPAPTEPKISQAEAANMLNVSERSVATVKAVEKAAPELVEKIITGEITPHAAYQRVKARREEAAKMAGVSTSDMAKIDHIEKFAPQLMPKLESGEMTLSRAITETRRAESHNKPAVASPDGKYRVFYADPPWHYGNSGLDDYGHAERHYPTMTIEQLCALPVKEMSEDNAVLFLWVTSPLLAECFEVIAAWGFKYKTSFIWDKVGHNYGHYNSVRHELLLVCTKGSCTPDEKKLFPSVQRIEKTSKHSEKPSEFREIIDTIYPHGKRIELFARVKVDGWEAWGNDL